MRKAAILILAVSGVFLSLGQVSPISGVSRLVRITPRRVLFLEETGKLLLGTNHFAVRAATYSRDRWAVLVSMEDKSCAVLAGDLTSESSFAVGPKLERLFLDASGRLTLARFDGVGFELLNQDWEGGTLTSAGTIGLSVAPFYSDGKLMWRSLHADPAEVPPPTQTPYRVVQPVGLPPDTTAKILEPRYLIVGLPAGRHVAFSDRTEQITLYEADGSLVGTAQADLDSAYRALGLTPRRVDPLGNESRVMWASSSIEGELYVCLSQTPVIGPAEIAVINPASGSLIRVLRAELPKAEMRKRPSNPEGVMSPSMVAMGDGLAILDNGAKVLSLY